MQMLCSLTAYSLHPSKQLKIPEWLQDEEFASLGLQHAIDPKSNLALNGKGPQGFIS